MADGSIRIKTRIDNSKAKKDAEEFVKVVDDAADKAKESGKKATVDLDISKAEKEIKRLEKEISKYETMIEQLEAGKLGEYNSEREALNKSTKADMAKATSPEQKINIQSMHDTTMAQIEKKYSSVLNKADQYGKIISQNDLKIQQLRNSINQIKNSQQKVNSEQKQSASETSKTASHASRLSQMIKGAKTAAGQFAKSIGVAAYGGFKKVGSVIKNTVTKGLNKAVAGIKNMGKQADNLRKKFLKIGLALIAMRSLMAGFKQIVSSALNDNEKLQNQLTALKGVLGIALAPVINAVLNALTNVVTLVDKVYQAFTGISLIAKYNAQQAQKLADSTSDAADSAKEYKNQLAGFDVANKFTDNSSTSNKSSDSDTLKNFEASYSESISKFAEMIKSAWEKTDFTDVGKKISEKLVGMLQNIDWVNIKSKGFGAGKSFATLVNGLFSYSDSDGNTLSTSIGKTIGESLNTIVSTAKGFATNLNWKKVGTELANGLLKTISTIDFENVGETIHDFITGLCDSIASFFNRLTENDDGYKTIKKSITDFFNGLKLSDITLSIIKATVSIANFSFNILSNLLDDIIQSICDKFGWEWDGSWLDLGPLGIKVPKIKFNFGSDNSETDSDNDLSWWDKLVEKLGKKSPIIAALGTGVGTSTITTTINGSVSSSFTDLKTKWDSIKEKGKEAITTIKGSVNNTFTNLEKKWDSIKNKTNISTIKGSVNRTFTNLKSKWDSLKSKVSTSTIKGKIHRSFNTAKSNWNSLKNKTTTITTKLKDSITSGIRKILNSLVSMVNKVITVLNKLPGINISKINPPMLAKGGIVNNPGRGIQATIGEAGAEAVLPLQNNTEWMDIIAEKLAQKISNNGQPIVVYSVIDGKIVGKAVAKYNNQQNFIRNGGTV